MDWERDDTRTARIAAMDWRQRYRTAVMALCRLRTSLLEVGLLADWGISPDLVGSLFGALLADPAEAVDHEVRARAAELTQAPLFASEQEPEFAEQVQLEVLSGLLMLGEGVMELDAKRADYIVYRVRAMTTYVDAVIADSLAPDPDEEAHQRYLSRLGDEVRAYGVGYFGSRNLELEFDCRTAIEEQGEAEGFFSSTAGRELLARGDEYGAEVAAVLRRFAG